MIYIIIWAIISTGDVTYVNPIYEHTIVYEETDLAKTVDEISKKSYRVDIKVYKAYPCDVELGYKEEKEVSIKKIPYLKSIKDFK